MRNAHCRTWNMARKVIPKTVDDLALTLIYFNFAELIPICRFLQCALDDARCTNDGIFKTAEEPQHLFSNIEVSFLSPLKNLIISLFVAVDFSRHTVISRRILIKPGK